MPTPKYLYKILDAPPLSPLPETLPTSDLDARDGFIHLSLAPQIPITANRFFANCETVWLLKMQPQALNGVVKYETDPDSRVPKGCAHLHESKAGLGRGNIEAVIAVSKDDLDDWTKVPAMQSLENGE